MVEMLVVGFPDRLIHPPVSDPVFIALLVNFEAPAANSNDLRLNGLV